MEALEMKAVVCAVIALGALCLPAWGQTPGQTALKYQDTKDTDHPLISAAQVTAGNYDSAPKGVTAPEGLSGGAKWHRANLGGRQMYLVTEPRGGMIYADTNFDNSLADETPMTGVSYRSKTFMPGASLAQFGPFELKAGEERKAQIRITTFGQEYLMVAPAGFVTAKATLPTGVRSVAVVDANYDGRYDGAIGQGEGADLLAIDFDGDSKIEPTPDAGELMALPKMFKAGEKWQGIVVEADGSALTLGDMTPVFGSVSVPTAETSAVVWGDSGMSRIGGTTDAVELPTGSYRVAGVTVSAKDKRGTLWRANSASIGKQLSSFTVEEGKTTQLVCGAPLVVKPDASALRNGQQTFGVSLYGQGGEKYDIMVMSGSTAVTAPGIKILAEDGKTLATGAFSYG
jgi:hypothetical protein